MTTASQLHREIHVLEDKIQRWTADLERNKKQVQKLKEKLDRINMQKGMEMRETMKKKGEYNDEW